MKLKDFPGTYTGEKNCFDCKHFKIKAPVRADGFIKYNNGKARCTKGGLLREPKNKGCAREPSYSFSSVSWKRIQKGWRHFEWGVAGVCEDYESMNDEIKKEEIHVSTK